MKEYTLATDVNAVTFTTTEPLSLVDLKDGSFCVKFSGSNVVGTLTLEAQVADSYPWVTVDGSSQAVTASAPHIWNFTVANYKKLRVAWAYTSGTGNISIVAILKEYPIIGA